MDYRFSLLPKERKIRGSVFPLIVSGALILAFIAVIPARSTSAQCDPRRQDCTKDRKPTATDVPPTFTPTPALAAGPGSPAGDRGAASGPPQSGWPLWLTLLGVLTGGALIARFSKAARKIADGKLKKKGGADPAIERAGLMTPGSGLEDIVSNSPPGGEQDVQENAQDGWPLAMGSETHEMLRDADNPHHFPNDASGLDAGTSEPALDELGDSAPPQDFEREPKPKGGRH